MFLIDLSKKESIFEQIKGQIEKFINVGVLKSNDKLPSVRNLANELGINPNTVMKAYAELEKQGYIYTINKKGVFVAKNIAEITKQDENSALKVLEVLKNEGFSKNEIINLLNKVFKEDEKC